MKILIPGLVVFTIWCVISVRWYVCGIHELCKGEEKQTKEQIEKPRSKSVEELLTPPARAPLGFEWSSAAPIVSENFNYFKDSVKTVFDQQPAAVVEVTGFYDPQELNNTDYDNLGLARADNIKRLLLNSGIKRSIRINSATEDLSSGLSGAINQAYQFRLMPLEQPSDDFIISEDKNKIVIHFPTNSASPESSLQVRQALQKLSRTALTNERRILVVGHTDSYGEALENKKLGLKRASKVKDLLITYGMSEVNVLAESEGEDVPLVSNSTARGRQQNRRVEIIVI